MDVVAATIAVWFSAGLMTSLLVGRMFAYASNGLRSDPII